MKKLLLSAFESAIAGLVTWKVAIPIFLELAKTGIGNWAYLGLLSFLLIVIAEEIASYQENKLTWLMSKFFGHIIEK